MEFVRYLEVFALIFYAGSNWQMLREHERRITSLENKKR